MGLSVIIISLISNLLILHDLVVTLKGIEFVVFGQSKLFGLFLPYLGYSFDKTHTKH